MKNFRLYILVLFSPFYLCLSEVSAQTWTYLFDGSSFAGWEQLGGSATYVIKDSAIVGYPKINTENSFLCTTREYDDFILEFDFYVDKGLNSGVQFRSHSLCENQKSRVYGYQFEIDPSNRAWTGGIYDEARRGWLYPLSKNKPARKAFRNKQWNHARIEAFGPRVRTWVNGIPCADLIDSVDFKGCIALQVHSIGNDKGKEGNAVYWRNIRICSQDAILFSMQEYPGIPQIIAGSTQKASYELRRFGGFFHGLFTIPLALLMISMIMCLFWALIRIKNKNH